jgi:hypothetical protein
MGIPPQRFEECYHCYSVAYADKSHLEVSQDTVSQAKVIGRAVLDRRGDLFINAMV